MRPDLQELLFLMLCAISLIVFTAMVFALVP